MYSVPVNGALWTIKVEVAFYLLLPLLVLIIEKIRSQRGKNVFLVCCYASSVLWNFLFEWLGQGRGSSFLSDMAHQFPGFVSYFVSGMLCVYNWKFLQKNLNKMVVPSVLIFFMHYFIHTEILMPLALSICVMWFGLALKRLYFVGEKSDFSYGMYLTHFPVIQFCIALGHFEKMPFFTFLLVVCASFAMAYLMNCAMSRKEM